MIRPQTETTFYITQNLILPGKASISAITKPYPYPQNKTVRLQMLAQNATIVENENLDITNRCDAALCRVGFDLVFFLYLVDNPNKRGQSDAVRIENDRFVLKYYTKKIAQKI